MTVALVSDLIFESKLSGTARVLGAELRVVRRAADLLTAASDAQRVIVDLSLGDEVLVCVRRLKQLRPEVRVIGFLSHVQASLARAAREAGVDQVLPRSKFAEQIADLLKPHA